MGTAADSAGAAGPSEGLRAGRSSGLGARLASRSFRNLLCVLIPRTMNHALDSAGVLVLSEPRYVQELPNIFAETRTSSPVLPARHLQLVRHEQARRKESDRVQDSASEEADSNLTTTLNFPLSSH